MAGVDLRVCLLAGARVSARGADVVAVRRVVAFLAVPVDAGAVAAVAPFAARAVGRLRAVDVEDARVADAVLAAAPLLFVDVDAVATLRAAAVVVAVPDLREAPEVALVLRAVVALPAVPDAALRVRVAVDVPAPVELRALVALPAPVALLAVVFLRATPVAGAAARLRAPVLRALVLRVAIGSSIDIAA